MTTEYDPPARPTLPPIPALTNNTSFREASQNPDDFRSDLGAYLDACSKKASISEPGQTDEHDWSQWTLDPETGYYCSVEQRLCCHWDGTAWLYLDYDAVYGNRQECDEIIDRREDNDPKDQAIAVDDEEDKATDGSPTAHEPIPDDQSSFIHAAPPGFTLTTDSRYSYNQLQDIWHDARTNTFSRFDAEAQTYIPIAHSDAMQDTDSPIISNEPGSDDTLRLVVVESKVLPAGSLVLVDANGLTMGRDRSWDRRLRLPEMETSKFHCQIYLDTVAVVIPPVNTRADEVGGPAGQAKGKNEEHGTQRIEGDAELLADGMEELTDGVIEPGTCSTSSPTPVLSHTSIPITTTCFFITDVGSQNGTYVNSHRLSDPKCSSSPHPLRHMDSITVGSSTFEVHQHASGWPCERCKAREDNVIDVDEDRTAKPVAEETGSPMNNVMAAVGLSQRESLEIQRREELRRMKRKFGASSSSATTASPSEELTHRPNKLHASSSRSLSSSSSATTYIDRAKLRRQQYYDSSFQPSTRSSSPEPPPVISATTETRIGTDNIGNRMLQRMGWREGSGLGQKGREGKVDPIAVSINETRAGLGTEKLGTGIMLGGVQETVQQRTRRLARERFFAEGGHGNGI